MSKRSTCITLLLLFLVGAGGDALGQTGRGKKEPVVLQLHWRHQFEFAGYYAALAKGFYREAGLGVTIREASSYSEPVEAVVAGRAQFGVAGSDLLVARSKGHPVVALAAIFQHSPLVFIAKRSSGIDHVHDIAGKRVMIEPHSHALMAYLQDEGVSGDTLIRHPHVFDPAPLIQDDVDVMSAYITDEPYLFESRGIEIRAFSPRSGGIDFYNDLLFTTEKEFAAHPERVHAFRAASLRGWEYAFAHEDEMIDEILANYSQRHTREHLKYEAAEMRRLVMPDIVELGYMNPGRWEHIAETYARLEMIPADTSLAGFLYKEKTKSDAPWTFAVLGGIVVTVALLGLMWLSQACRDWVGRLARHHRLRNLLARRQGDNASADSEQ